MSCNWTKIAYNKQLVLSKLQGQSLTHDGLI